MSIAKRMAFPTATILAEDKDVMSVPILTFETV